MRVHVYREDRPACNGGRYWVRVAAARRSCSDGLMKHVYEGAGEGWQMGEGEKGGDQPSGIDPHFQTTLF